MGLCEDVREQFVKFGTPPHTIHAGRHIQSSKPITLLVSISASLKGHCSNLVLVLISVRNCNNDFSNKVGFISKK